MGKSGGKKKKQSGEKSADSTPRHAKIAESSPKAYDQDTQVFIAMSQDLKDEGNQLFQRRDYEGALLKYEKALKLLPRNHIDVAYIRSNMAASYMQMGISDYPRAVHECNLALEVSPKYSKALIKRARCYEGLNRLELALRDLNTVLSVEPNNLTALELVDRVKQTIESRGDRAFDHPVPEYVEPIPPLPPVKVVKDKSRKKNSIKSEEETVEEKAEGKVPEKQVEDQEKNMEDKSEKEVEIDVVKKVDTKGKKKKSEAKRHNRADDGEKKVVEDQIEKRAEDKLVIEERIASADVDEPKKNVKLVFGEDIRWAQLPVNCSLLKLREVILDRFPTSGAVFVKYKDHEGDMITITSDKELRWAEASMDPQGSVKLYIVEVSPEHDPFYEKLQESDTCIKEKNFCDNGVLLKKKGDLCVEEWTIQFAHLFKNYVGFSCDAYLDLHEIGVKLYSEAMEEMIGSEEAQVFFDMAAEKFQEMAALALFNWGNVHMSKARKRVQLTEDSSPDMMLDEVKQAYDWAQLEYQKAGQKYEDALKIKANFYEGHLALAQQQFEQAKLAWYYAVATQVDLDSWGSSEVLDLYNCAEENIDKGMHIWEELEHQRLEAVTSPSNGHAHMPKTGLDRLFEDASASGAAQQAKIMRSQVYVLWGTMLYERSIMEFKLDLPVWHECLEAAVEKFELAGASPTDIAVMIKNHCSSDSALDGIGFRIDEIVQAWTEMDDARKWYTKVPSYRVEPLLRRRVSKLYDALEQA